MQYNNLESDLESDKWLEITPTFWLVWLYSNQQPLLINHSSQTIEAEKWIYLVKKNIKG